MPERERGETRSRCVVNVAYLLLGSNIEKEVNLPAAVRLLGKLCDLRAVSSVYETLPVGRPDQATFFNAAALVHTPLDADHFKREVISLIEHRLKRVRRADKYAPRTIDVDIVLFNDAVFEYDGRPIPDPDLLKFPHAAVPLAELSPDRLHPETGERLADIAQRLLDAATQSNAGVAPLWKRPDVLLV